MIKYLEIIVFEISMGGGGVYSQREAYRITFYIFVWYGGTIFNIY